MQAKDRDGSHRAIKAANPEDQAFPGGESPLWFDINEEREAGGEAPGSLQNPRPQNFPTDKER